MELRDPKKKPHEIVDTVDGVPIRNDGVALQDANQNPWYVLATLYDEQAEGASWISQDEERATQNRDAWNLWFCHGLSDEELLDRAERVELQPEELVPFSDGKRDAMAAKKKLAVIRRKIIKRLKCAGVKNPKPPDQSQKIDFSQTYFLKFLSFANFVFENECDFRNSMFGAATYFHTATFEEAVFFRSVMFKGHADFRHAKFARPADFSSAKFEGNANLHSAEFAGAADFRSVTFACNADFRNVAFEMSTFFQNAIFMVSADFRSAAFMGAAYFRSVRFCDSAWFRSASFRKEAYFCKDWTRKKGHKAYAIDPTSFEKDTDFSLATFKSTTTFEEAKFLSHVPEFHAAELFDDTAFPSPDKYRDNWPSLSDVGAREIEKQRKAYSRLRHHMGTASQIDEEQFFHRQEMRCKRETEGWHYRWLYTLFEGISDYGNSVLRPAGWLFTIWLSGMIAKLQMVEGSSLPDYRSIPQAMGWSFANLFSFFGFYRRYFWGEKLNEVLQLFSGVQTVLGFVLLFLLGLGLRNRFRLR